MADGHTDRVPLGHREPSSPRLVLFPQRVLCTWELVPPTSGAGGSRIDRSDRQFLAQYNGILYERQ